MKIFTVEQANEIIPVIRRKLEQLKYLYAAVAALRDQAKLAAAASQSGGGGMIGGSIYVEELNEMSKVMSGLGNDGIQLKDISRGLIDFPCMLMITTFPFLSVILKVEPSMFLKSD